jgi:hypothetical protein
MDLIVSLEDERLLKVCLPLPMGETALLFYDSLRAALKERDEWMAYGTSEHNAAVAADSRAEEAGVCTECNGGCPEKEHPVTRRYCEECWQHGFKKSIELLQDQVSHLGEQVEWAIRELDAYGHITAANTLRRRK